MSPGRLSGLGFTVHGQSVRLNTLFPKECTACCAECRALRGRSPRLDPGNQIASYPTDKTVSGRTLRWKRRFKPDWGRDGVQRHFLDGLRLNRATAGRIRPVPYPRRGGDPSAQTRLWIPAPLRTYPRPG